MSAPDIYISREWVQWLTILKKAVETPRDIAPEQVPSLPYTHILMDGGYLLGRTSAGNGVAQQITVSAPLGLANGALTLAGLPASYVVGDLLYANSATTLTRLSDVAVGSYLRSGGVATAPLWSTLTLPNAATTGDLFYASASNTMSRLADVAVGSYLRSGGVATAPLWSTLVLPNAASSGDILKASGANTYASVAPAALTKVDDTNVTLTLGGTPASALVNAASLTLGWTGTLGVSRGGTNLGSYTTGDLLYASSGAVLAKRGIGSTDDVLTVSGGVPVWSAAAAVATAVTITDDTTTNATMYPTWVTAASGNRPVKVSSTKFNWNPSTGSLGIGNTSTTATDGLTVGNQTGAVYALHLRGDNNALTTYPGIRTGGAGSIVVEANAAAGGKVFLGVDNSATVSIAGGGGNVVIGGTSSGSALDVIGSTIRFTSNPCTFLLGGSAGSTSVSFVNDGSSPRIVTAASLPFYIGVFGLALSTATKWDASNNLDVASQKLYVNITSGNVGIGAGTTPSAALHLKAGTATASTAPLKFTSGTLLTTAEAGAVEFLTDAFYGTITTGAARKTFAFLESPSFTTPTLGAASGTSLALTGAVGTYKNVATAGWGLPAIYASARSTAQTAAVASVAAYTVGASDGSFLVTANVNVTVATTHNFTVTCAYTDETNTARTATLSFQLIAGGAPITAVANGNGTVPYMGVPQQIRCKASTAITIATTGTFTTVTYNVEGIIQQLA